MEAWARHGEPVDRCTLTRSTAAVNWGQETSGAPPIVRTGARSAVSAAKAAFHDSKWAYRAPLPFACCAICIMTCAAIGAILDPTACGKPQTAATSHGERTLPTSPPCTSFVLPRSAPAATPCNMASQRNLLYGASFRARGLRLPGPALFPMREIWLRVCRAVIQSAPPQPEPCHVTHIRSLQV